MISVELNTAIKAHFLTLGGYFSSLKFIPISGPQNLSAPFIIYNEFPSTVDDERFFINNSSIIYDIYDNDISRMKEIGRELDKFLNVGDYVEEIRALLSTPYYGGSPLRYRVTTCRKVSGGTRPSTERDGFYLFSINYKVTYNDFRGA